MQAVWERLGQAAQEACQPWHWPALATVEQGQPRVRTVVLRSVNQTDRALIAQVHAASPKVTQLELQPQAEWLFYDPQLRIQVRARGQTRLHYDDQIANERWQTLPSVARQMYRGTLPPSSPYTGNNSLSSTPAQPSPFAEDLTGGIGKAFEDPDKGREHFCVLVTQVDRIDWYDLRPANQIRWLFEWHNSKWQAQPLVP